MAFLLIETSTEHSVIAFGSGTEVQNEKQLPLGLNQSKFLLPFLEELLKDVNHSQIQAIAVGIGPGSYTGIRIGVAVAQTLSYCWQLPLIGISSLEGFIPSQDEGEYISLIDARIGGVYFQKKEGDPQLSSLENLGEHLKRVKTIVSPVLKKLQPKLKESYPDLNCEWEERYPSSSTLLKKAQIKFNSGQTVLFPQQLEILYLRQTEAERAKPFR